MSRSRGIRDRRQRGASAIITALTISVVGGLLALSLNVGHILLVRNQLQNGVDAAALAAADSLDGTLAGLTDVRTRAQDFGGRHATGRHSIVLDLNTGNTSAGDIVLGEWLPGTGEFLPLTAGTAADARRINAVKVHGGRLDDDPLPVFLSGFLGKDTATVGATAIAIGGSPCEGCAIPIVFPDCEVVQPDGSLACDKVLVWSDSNVDNIGFTSLSTDPTNPNSVVDALRGGCTDVNWGDTINVNNGNFLASTQVLRAFSDLVGQEVTAPIVDVECNNQDYVHDKRIVGFATFVITEVTFAGSDKSITMQFKCDQGTAGDEEGGCGVHYGTTAPETRLVE